MDSLAVIILLKQIIVLATFFLIFFTIHYIFKKKIDFKQTLIVFFLAIYTLLKKTDLGLWLEHIDPYFHIGFSFYQAGFPAFFWIQYLFDLIFINSFYFLPLFFGAMSCYVFLVWLNQKKINLIVLFFLVWFFIHEFIFLFSFSKEVIIMFFSLLFFYFLEKHYYLNSRKNLVAATLFLMLACLTKITGFLLIPFYLWVLMQKKRSNFYLIPLTIILLFMFFKTNLASNLHGGNSIIDLNLVLISILTICISNFVVWLFVFFPPFIKPKKFLFQLNVYVLILILVVGIKHYFLVDSYMVTTLKRYFIIFLLPLILWISNESELIFIEIKNYWRD